MVANKARFKIQAMEAKTLLWWHSKRTKIDMSPSYQRRGRLWSQTDKAFLIDSILNGFDVPKLYIADFTWGDSTLNQSQLPFAIVDGKQRLEAIFDFFDGNLVLNDDFVFRVQPSLKLGGLGYKDLKSLHSEIAEIFETYNLSVMSVVADSVEPINELFLRLNRSKPLTGAEIRNAMNGPAPQVVRRIAAHEFFKNNIAFSVVRSSDLNAATKLLAFEYKGEPVETKKRNLDTFIASSTDPDRLELVARRVLSKLDELTEIFLPEDKLLQSEGILPVYYWFIRQIDPSRMHLVREFLVSFEHRRKENREAAKVGAPKIDSSMVEFDSLNRSTNDLLSHTRRFEILKREFDAKANAINSTRKPKPSINRKSASK